MLYAKITLVEGLSTARPGIMPTCRAVRPKGVTMLQERKDRAYQLGHEAGKAAGSWVIDGNTTRRTCEVIIRGFEDGDPEIMDMRPASLSGERADSMTPQALLRELGCRDDSRFSDGLCDMYDDGFSTAWWDEVIEHASVQVRAN